MCTAVFGLGTLGPGTVIVATNRDEDPRRASEPPRVLREAPRLAGGRDAVAGGTWLAVRPAATGRAASVTMLLNRHDPEPAAPGRRSRGLLTLDVAGADDPRARALAEAATGRYAPCSLVHLAGDGAWLLAIRATGPATLDAIAPGWHALAHHELDDAADPRTAWLGGQMRGFAPTNRAEAEHALHGLVTSHRDAHAPGVCLHEGPAPTVSSAAIWIAPGELAYRHAEGRPCVRPLVDQSALLREAGA
jgi:hypothetical protein